jgi:hypothetical protein
MEFFTDTQNTNCYPMEQLWTDLTNNAVGRYNWITPDEYNEMHSSLSSGFTYHGTLYTGNQAAIAAGDHCLSIIIPKIMASAAYQSNGVIIIWMDETRSTDDTNTTLPYFVISPLAKGNAYASSVELNHSSDLKTMDEIFGLAYQTNAIPSAEKDAENNAYDYVDGRSATVNDLSDMFRDALAPFAFNVVPGGTNMAFSFPGQSCYTNCQVQYKKSQTDPNWSVLGDVVTGADGVITVMDQATAGTRFYRVLVQ